MVRRRRGGQRSRIGAGTAAAAVFALVLVGVTPGAEGALIPSGGITVTGVTPGSAAQGGADSAATFAVDVRADELGPGQDVRSLLVTLPSSGWTAVGPPVGTAGSLGWSARGLDSTSICWGGRTSLPSGSVVSTSVTAWTDGPLGTATWTVRAFGDADCTRDVKPALAAPVAEAYVAVARVVETCAATASCSTPVVADKGNRSTVAVTGTGQATGTSFVSAAVLDDLGGPFGTLTCPETANYDPDLGRTAQTVVSGAARSHVIAYTLAKPLVNLVADNGASRMAVCLRSEIPFRTRSGEMSTSVGLFRRPGSGVFAEMYDGFVPACDVPAVAPCILDQFKRNGDMVWNIVLPPGDPYVH